MAIKRKRGQGSSWTAVRIEDEEEEDTCKILSFLK
jgi:hypothetical protein